MRVGLLRVSLFFFEIFSNGNFFLPTGVCSTFDGFIPHGFIPHGNFSFSDYHVQFFKKVYSIQDEDMKILLNLILSSVSKL